MWLRFRVAVAAAALIEPLACEPPYVTGAALRRKKNLFHKHLWSNCNVPNIMPDVLAKEINVLEVPGPWTEPEAKL